MIISMRKNGFSWISSSLETKETKKYGNGVFASAPIDKGEVLMIFGGYILTRAEECELPESIRDIAIQVERDFVIGVMNENELGNADFVNHSCNPNSGIRGQISLVAMRDIEEGEEITFDYGSVLYRKEGSQEYKLKCVCGSDGCRGEITQFDWKNPQLQARCRGFFPYYIQDEIDKLNRK